MFVTTVKEILVKSNMNFKNNLPEETTKTLVKSAFQINIVGTLSIPLFILHNLHISQQKSFFVMCIDTFGFLHLPF